jgi:ferredoxin-NADP reductase
MYSAAHDEYLDFLIRVVPDGVVSPWLAKCEVGDLVEIGGPYGDFCLLEEETKSNEYVFIATGTGIAPFHSFVKSFPTLRYHIYHGVRHENERYDFDFYAPDRYSAAVSRPRLGTFPSERVTDLLEQATLKIDSRYYLCGNQKMITDTIALLLSKGIPGGSIFTETFF